MAEVTREMILEYMTRKGGVVKNVDLVRHFRKYLQVDNPVRKDQARDIFKERVNTVAFIKAEKGEKYLYLKPEFYPPGGLHRPSSGRLPSFSASERSSASSFDSPTHTYTPHRPAPPPPPHHSPSLRTRDSLSNLPHDKPISQPSPKPTSSSGQFVSDLFSPPSHKPTSSSSQFVSDLFSDSKPTHTSSPSYNTTSSSGQFVSDLFSDSKPTHTSSPSYNPTSSSGQFVSELFSPPSHKPASSSGQFVSDLFSPPSHKPASSSSQFVSDLFSDSKPLSPPGIRDSGVVLQSYKPVSSSPPKPTVVTPPLPPSTRTFSPHTTASSSLLSPPLAQSSTADMEDNGESLLAQMTAELSNFGSFLNSFGMASSPGTSASPHPEPAKHIPPSSTAPHSTPPASSSRVTGRSLTSLPPPPTSLPPPPTTSPRPPPPSIPHTKPPIYPTFHPPSSFPPPPTSTSPPSALRRLGPSIELPSTNGLSSSPPGPVGAMGRANGRPRRQGSLDDTRRQGSLDRTHSQRMESPTRSSDSSSPNETGSPLSNGGQRNRHGGSFLNQSLPVSSLGPALDVVRNRSHTTAAVSGLGVPLRRELSPHDGRVIGRPHSNVGASARRSRNFEKNANLESITRASIMMTPPARRKIPPPMVAPKPQREQAPGGSFENISIAHEGDDEGSVTAISEGGEADYYDIDPLEKEWMLAAAQANLDGLHRLMMMDLNLLNRRDFIHTALHWAAKHGRCDIMAALILNGAQVDIKSGGFTPLHLAAQSGYDNAIHLLIKEHGASVNTRDHTGRRPIDMLSNKASEETKTLLIQGLNTYGLPVRAVHRTQHLATFSQPRQKRNSLNRLWSSAGDILERRVDLKKSTKKQLSPRMSIRKSFSFRKDKRVSPKKDTKENKRPRSTSTSKGVLKTESFKWDV